MRKSSSECHQKAIFAKSICINLLFFSLLFISSPQDKDQYGNEVQKLARPLPVEYLLVDLPTSSPLTPLYTFPAHEHPFPVENRQYDERIQDLTGLHNYMQRFKSPDFLMVREREKFEVGSVHKLCQFLLEFKINLSIFLVVFSSFIFGKKT